MLKVWMWQSTEETSGDLDSDLTTNLPRGDLEEGVLVREGSWLPDGVGFDEIRQLWRW